VDLEVQVGDLGMQVARNHQDCRDVLKRTMATD